MIAMSAQPPGKAVRGSCFLASYPAYANHVCQVPAIYLAPRLQPASHFLIFIL